MYYADHIESSILPRLRIRLKDVTEYGIPDEIFTEKSRKRILRNFWVKMELSVFWLKKSNGKLLSLKLRKLLVKKVVV